MSGVQPSAYPLAGYRALRLALDLPLTEAAGAIAAIRPHLDEGEVAAADAIVAHVAKTGKLPHPTTVVGHMGAPLPDAHETLEYEQAVLRARSVDGNLRQAVNEASGILTGEHDPERAMDTLMGRLVEIKAGSPQHSVSDAREIESTALAAYKSQLSGTAAPITALGYPTLDKMGGIADGDIVGLIGPPGSGKTWVMLRTALYLWGTYGEPVLFVTQEMRKEHVEARMLPLVAGVDPGPLYRGQPIQPEVHGLDQKDYMAALEQAAQDMSEADAPFLTYDTRMAGSVQDVATIASMHGVRTVVADGAYLFKHPDRRLNRYQRVGENLDLMKADAQATGRRWLTSWQFQRGKGKGGASDDPTLDDIGYSHAVGEYCSTVLGLLSPADSVSQLKRKDIHIMKGRNGEQGRFRIHWNFKVCDFSEVTEEESTADLSHL